MKNRCLIHKKIMLMLTICTPELKLIKYFEPQMCHVYLKDNHKCLSSHHIENSILLDKIHFRYRRNPDSSLSHITPFYAWYFTSDFIFFNGELRTIQYQKMPNRVLMVKHFTLSYKILKIRLCYRHKSFRCINL